MSITTPAIVKPSPWPWCSRIKLVSSHEIRSLHSSPVLMRTALSVDISTSHLEETIATSKQSSSGITVQMTTLLSCEDLCVPSSSSSFASTAKLYSVFTARQNALMAKHQELEKIKKQQRETGEGLAALRQRLEDQGVAEQRRW